MTVRAKLIISRIRFHQSIAVDIEYVYKPEGGGGVGLESFVTVQLLYRETRYPTL
jgi:hypothetical protein